MKFIIFDLDGVLVDAKLIHYEALNRALNELNPAYVIPWNVHLSTYDGLKTAQKLELLTKNVGLPTDKYKQIWYRKQEITQSLISNLSNDYNLIELFKKLKSDGYTLACCSNSIRRSVLTMLSKIGIIEYMDLVLSNEDVRNSKPHPEIYWHAMSLMEASPDEVLIVEDSPPGLLAASKSGTAVLRIASPKDLTYELITSKLQATTNAIVPKWENKKMNIVIPMAGAGSRFSTAGYTFPKPLIPINKFDQQPMIQVVVGNLNIDAKFIFIVQKEHYEKYNLEFMLKLISPNCTIVQTEGVTQGAACSVLLAKEHINNEEALLISDSDHFVEWNSNEFMYYMQENSADGGSVTFTGTHPMWSYCRVDENTGYVAEVAEKKPISTDANVGRYYWAKGSDFVKYAERMIERNIRVNNEFYVSPVYNQAIEDGKKIKIYPVKHMWSLGTPSDLEYFERNYQK